MTEYLRWPAFGDEPYIPGALHVERGVWGKAHGARTDFRWLAGTPGLYPGERRLEHQLVMDSEDDPRQTQLWRALAVSFCAVGCYPSPARDHAGRSGFLEKQVLVWDPRAGRAPAPAPAVLGALLLLPSAASLDAAVWWEQRNKPEWDDPSFVLPLDPEPSVPVDSADLDDAVADALSSLAERVREAALARFYLDLLTGVRPALLSQREPLPPQALAALLLPLPRPEADRLSLAGWALSRSYRPGAPDDPWDVVVYGREVAGAPPPARREADARRAQEMARAVRDGRPPAPGLRPPRRTAAVAVTATAARPPPEVVPPPSLRTQAVVRDGAVSSEDLRSFPALSPPAQAEQVSKLVLGGAPFGAIDPLLDRAAAALELRCLLRFALTGDEFWLAPEALAGALQRPLRRFPDAGIEPPVLHAAIKRVDAQSRKREHVRRTLETKMDGLRAAAIVLCPAPDAIALTEQIGDTVAPLMFAPMLAQEDWPCLERLGPSGLARALERSLACGSGRDAAAVWHWAQMWLTTGVGGWIQEVLERKCQEGVRIGR